MGMTDNNVLSHSSNTRSLREARRAKEESLKHFDKKETARYREAIATFGKEAKEARAERKVKRTEAKEKCSGYVSSAKERTQDKPPHRRRAELAKARTDCAFDVMNVEEQTAQALEEIERKREEEVTRRRGSRIATKNNRARSKEQTRSTARERLEEMFDQIRNDLDPGVLPYFEEIKGSAALRKLLDGGRMSPTEAVLHMAHEDPERVFAALERQAEKELQELMREQERWEYEGGRLAEGQLPGDAAMGEDAGAPAEESAPAGSKPRRAAKGRRKKASDAEASGAKASGAKDATSKETKPRARKGNTKGSDTKDDAPAKGDAPATRASSRSAGRVLSDQEQEDRDLERFEDEGGRPSPHEMRARPPRETRSEPRTIREGDRTSVGLHQDGDHWFAITWAESRRFSSWEAAVAWLKARGFHADGTPIDAPEPTARPALVRDEDARSRAAPSEDDGEIDALFDEVPASLEEPPVLIEEPPHSEVRGPAARDLPPPEAPRPSCGGRCQRAAAPSSEHAPGMSSAHATHDQAMHRLSPEERTGWIPGTEPARPPPAESAPRVRTTLFEDEDDTWPETPDAKRRDAETTEPPSATKKKDHGVQQAFGTDFTNWLHQAGPQLTLDSTPARPAPRLAPEPRPALPPAASPPAAQHVTRAPVPPATVARDTAASVPEARTPEISTPEVRPAPSDRITVAPYGVPLEMPRQSVQTYTGGKLHIDRGARTLQVQFDDMPDARFRIALRNAGFRWTPALQRWQAPFTDEGRETAESVLIEHANVVTARQARRGGGARSRASSAPIDSDISAPRPEPREGAERALPSDGAVPLDPTADAALVAEEEPIADDADSGDDDPRNAYEQKRADHVARLRARADELQATSDAIYNDARAKADRIPFGQPILVGHHSEGRDRRFREKIRQGYGKAFELQGEAEQLRRRADAAEKSGAISSDDPDAIAKLEAKVKERGDFIYRARDINEVIRAARAGRKSGWEPIAVQRLVAMGVDAATASKLVQKDFAGRIGIPGYAVKNAQGEIARLNRRIEELKERDARPARAPERIGEAVIVENRDTNRLEIRFDGIPPKDLRSHLRGRGFVWAPSVGAWQRKLNDNALWTARDVLRSFYPQEKPAEPPAPVVVPARDPGLDDEPYIPSTTPSEGTADAPLPF